MSHVLKHSVLHSPEVGLMDQSTATYLGRVNRSVELFVDNIIMIGHFCHQQKFFFSGWKNGFVVDVLLNLDCFCNGMSFKKLKKKDLSSLKYRTIFFL